MALLLNYFRQGHCNFLTRYFSSFTIFNYKMLETNSFCHIFIEIPQFQFSVYKIFQIFRLIKSHQFIITRLSLSPFLIIIRYFRLRGSKWSIGIGSALEKPHNGYFYVYKLPKNIEVGKLRCKILLFFGAVKF